MRTILLFPPAADPSQPYLSLPSLTAFLKQHGYSVIQRDVNIEAYETLLTGERLYQSYQRIYTVFSQLEQKDHLTYSEQKKYKSLALALLGAFDIIQNIDEAKEVMRNKKDFYDASKYAHHRVIIKRGLDLISAEYYPTKWKLRDYTMGYLPTSTDDILQAIHDEDENLFLPFFKTQVAPSILAQQPSLVGISIAFYCQLIPGLTLAYLIKQANPEVHITIGGGLMCFLAEPLRHNDRLFSIVDSFIVFEGEKALLELVKCLEAGTSLADVPNLIYAEDGKIQANEITQIEDVNSLPPPNFDGLPLESYLSPELVLPLLSTRGCYWAKCAFCSHHHIYHRHYRPRKPHLVLEDIRHLKERYQARSFYFVDEAITPQNLRTLSQLILENGLTIRWFSEARLEPSITPELAQLMAQAGCRMLLFGLESGSQRILDLMDKGIKVENISSVIQNCHRAHISVMLMFFFGFPSETQKEAQATVDLILANKDAINVVAYTSFVLACYADVCRFPEQFGVTKILTPDEDLRCFYRYDVASGLTMFEAWEMCKRLSTNQEFQEAVGGYPALTRTHSFFLKRTHFAQWKQKTSQRDETTPVGNPEFLACVPRLAEDVTVGSFRYDLNQIDNTLKSKETQIMRLYCDRGLKHKEIEQQFNNEIPPLMPKETHIIYQVNTDEMLDISDDTKLLLSYCDGATSVEGILSYFSDDNRESILQFLGMFIDRGVLTAKPASVEPENIGDCTSMVPC